MSLFVLAIVGANVVFLLMFATWLSSIKVADVSIIDRIWGLGFTLLAGVYFIVQSWSLGFHFRQVLVLCLVATWGIRLSWHIHRRNHGQNEDRRYVKIRARYGPSFWWKSFYVVFMTQGVLMFLISAPILLVFNHPGSSGVSFFDLLGLLIWSVGFYFEVQGDRQLKVFKSDQANRGKVMRTGLWGVTRHPNYFGDALMWWGLFVIALNVPMGLSSVFSPIIMTWLLTEITGVKLLEANLINQKEEYRTYITEVPAFFPSFAVFSKKADPTSEKSRSD